MRKHKDETNEEYAARVSAEAMREVTRRTTKTFTKAEKKGLHRADEKYGYTPLDLVQFRIDNVVRSEASNGFNHPLDAWSVAEWTNAICGEAGEAANTAKKLLRIRKNTRGNSKRDRDEEKLLKKLTIEIADALVYADLALASEGISLSEAVRKTWNRKSKEIGYNKRI